MNTEQERTYRQLTAVLDAGFLKVNSKLGDVVEQLKRTRTGIEPNDTTGDEVDEANRVLAWALEEAERLHIDAVNLLGQQLSHAQSVKQAYLHGWAGHMDDLLARATPAQRAVLYTLFKEETDEAEAEGDIPF